MRSRIVKYEVRQPEGRYSRWHAHGSTVAKKVQPKTLFGTIQYQQLPQSGMGLFGDNYPMPHDDEVKITPHQRIGETTLQVIGFSSACAVSIQAGEPVNPWKKHRGLHKDSSIFNEVIMQIDEDREVAPE